jgi:hypothetical protein
MTSIKRPYTLGIPTENGDSIKQNHHKKMENIIKSIVVKSGLNLLLDLVNFKASMIL